MDGLAAVTFQPLSCSHSGFKQENWLDAQPNDASMDLATDFGDPEPAGWPLAPGMAGPIVAAEAVAAEAMVATVSVPARAAIVSLFRFRVMMRRSRDKVTLRLVTRGRARLAA